MALGVVLNPTTWGGLPLHLSHTKKLEAESHHPVKWNSGSFMGSSVLRFPYDNSQVSIIYCQSLYTSIEDSKFYIVYQVYIRNMTVWILIWINQTKTKKNFMFTSLLPFDSLHFQDHCETHRHLPCRIVESTRTPNSRCLTGRNTEIKWFLTGKVLKC